MIVHWCSWCRLGIYYRLILLKLENWENQFKQIFIYATEYVLSMYVLSMYYNLHASI